MRPALVSDSSAALALFTLPALRSPRPPEGSYVEGSAVEGAALDSALWPL